MTTEETYKALKTAIDALKSHDPNAIKKAFNESDQIYISIIEKQLPVLQEQLNSIRKSYVVGAAGTPCGCCNGSGRS